MSASQYPATPPKVLTSTFHSVNTLSQCSSNNTTGNYYVQRPASSHGYRPVPHPSATAQTQSQCPAKTEKPPSPCTPAQKPLTSPPFPRPHSPMSPLCVSKFTDNDVDTELLLPVTSKIIDREGNQMFRCSAVGMNGYRYFMEDAHVMYCGQSFGLFAVFDGHAGSECSHYFSEKLPGEVAKLCPPLDNGTLEELLIDMDAKFRIQQHTSSGSTAAIVIATPLKCGDFAMQIAHVGDSRVLIGRGNKLRFATVDHKPSNPKERERIEKHGGFVRNDRVDGRLAMSRALGDSDFKIGTDNGREMRVTAVPEIHNLNCTKQDFLVIACDGIFESMTNEEVIEFVYASFGKTNDSGNICGKLADTALINGSTDNMTSMILQFKDGSKFKQPSEYLPGPYSVKQQNMFRNAYSNMVNKAGLTLESALAIRFHAMCDSLGKHIQLHLNSQPFNHAIIFELLSELKDMISEIKWDIGVIYNSVVSVVTKFIKEKNERVNTIFLDFLKCSIDAEQATNFILNLPKLKVQPAPEKTKPPAYANNTSGNHVPLRTKIAHSVSRITQAPPARDRKAETRAQGTWA